MAVEKNHLVFVAKQAINLTIIYLLNENILASVLPSECFNHQNSNLYETAVLFACLTLCV